MPCSLVVSMDKEGVTSHNFPIKNTVVNHPLSNLQIISSSMRCSVSTLNFKPTRNTCNNPGAIIRERHQSPTTIAIANFRLSSSVVTRPRLRTLLHLPDSYPQSLSSSTSPTFHRQDAYLQRMYYYGLISSPPPPQSSRFSLCRQELGLCSSCAAFQHMHTPHCTHETSPSPSVLKLLSIMLHTN
jgi:hypothetical protein